MRPFSKTSVHVQGDDASDSSSLHLIPAPSDDPRDPLRWSQAKKNGMLFILCLCGFAAVATPSCHQTSYLEIAPTFGRTPQEIVYTADVGVAGLLAGPVIFGPLARIIGRTSLIFWCLIMTMVTQIWAALMTKHDQYIPFLVSRLFAGMFASIPSVFGAGYILDVFFLHQRGRAFSFYELSFLLGVVASPTIGGYIVSIHPWPWVFWWTLIPLGLAATLVFVFLEDTQHAPGRQEPTIDLPKSWLRNRAATFLPGVRTVPRASASQVLFTAVKPFIIGVAPVTMIAGIFALIYFAWGLLIAIQAAIFLETPIPAGGYGFTARQNAAFTFTGWIAVVAAQIFGLFYLDAFPLWAARRFNSGVWVPEYRLWSLIVPSIIAPIALGIFGCALEYHLHPVVIALGWFLLNFASLLTVPVCLNYVAECFTGSAVEVGIIMNVYRLAFGISIGFYFESWQRRVGVGWLFGMCAFISIFASAMVAILAWQGHKLRRFVWMKSSLLRTEDGENIGGRHTEKHTRESA